MDEERNRRFGNKAKNSRRESTMFINEIWPNTWPWGYIIYRTVYTPESDELFPAPLSKLDRYIHRRIDRGVNTLASQNKLLHKTHKNVIVEGAQWFDARVGESDPNRIQPVS
ncbi:uncharacterized protein ATNIH1004_008786 [Aspergillus tanneri]|uniref:Uncharacterized protein n=1 Tax=Aspergillus tanneri TaxID=1220188 RepID=A0A5M9MCE6_9EURO|nr:uncharacterized protein ATNIH1004_008786 [Aspergillus tanneri]KAA8644581.1 hypothetical protein ATNIH1004_008786 [Aspergillus tanneri]